MKSITLIALCSLVLGGLAKPTKQKDTPNFIIMLMDDMGWGDLGVLGNPSQETPNLDRMAEEGMLLTDFYAASPVCSPSRASLLTGRLPIRNGFYSDTMPKFTSLALPNITGGIADSEILISELLQSKGYKSKFVGKWHLGHLPQYHPLKHGFDEYFGSPNNHWGPYDNVNIPNMPVYKDEYMAGRYFEGDFNISPTLESNISMIFLEESVDFIRRSARNGDPFFLVWAPDGIHAAPYASKEFLGTSDRGRYGDAVREMDHGVGKILKTLRNLDIEENTLVFFSSDNGAATYLGTAGGSNGPLLCGKFTTFEGGQRVPTIAWWPSHIKPNQVSKKPGTLMDLYQTFLDLAGIEMPDDRVLDSHSLVDRLTRDKVTHGDSSSSNTDSGSGSQDEGKRKKRNAESEDPETPIFYYRGAELYAVRYGFYKVHRWVFTSPIPNFSDWDFCPGDHVEGVTTNERVDYTAEPLLFHLGRDPGERYTISPSSDEYKTVMPEMLSIIDAHQASMVRGVAQLNYCNYASYPWAPEGCERIGQCLDAPPSEPEQCDWVF